MRNATKHKNRGAPSEGHHGFFIERNNKRLNNKLTVAYRQEMSLDMRLCVVV